MKKHFEGSDVLLRVNPETVKVLKSNNGSWLTEFEELVARTSSSRATQRCIRAVRHSGIAIQTGNQRRSRSNCSGLRRFCGSLHFSEGDSETKWLGRTSNQHGPVFSLRRKR